MEQTEPFAGRESPGGSAASEAREAVRERMNEAEEALHTADELVREFVSERPLIAIGGALLVGYMIGRLLSRS